MELFTIDPGLVLWTWITFGALLFLLGKFVFPPMLRNIRSRETAIRKSVDKANLIDQRLADIERERNETIRIAREEADRIVRKSRQEAEAVRVRLLEKADQEIQQLHAQAKTMIAEEREAAIKSIRNEIADLVCETSEKVIGRSFTSDEDRDWTRELVEAL